MNAITEKPSHSPTKATPTALQICNSLIISAKANSRAEGERRRMAFQSFRGSAPVIPATATLHEQTRLQMDHVNRGNALRSSSQNFNPQSYESALLDTDSNRAVLADALAFVRKAHSDFLKRPKPIAKVEVHEGRHLFQAESPHVPIPAPRVPVRGIWGQDLELDLQKEIARLSVEIEGFPFSQSFSEIVGGLNAANSAIIALTPKAKTPEAEPCRFTFTPKHG